jgi:hypothetical protein
MFVAGGFRAIECVLDHGPPEQGRGQRVLSFDQLRRRIQQVVEISVDLRGTGQDQLGGAGLVRPTSEKIERCPETPEAKGMSHGPFLGFNVFEIRQLLQVGAQLNG